MKNKNIIMNLVLFILFSSLILGKDSSLKIQPEKPKAGEKITVIYNPDGNKLANATNITMLIHAYGKSVYYTNETELKKSGSVWTGEFSAADTCAGVVLRFTDGKEFDNNGSKCFPIRFYGNDGKFAKYASGGLATGYINWFVAFEIDPDQETALKLYQEEFENNPSSMRDFLMKYYYAYTKVDREKAVEFMKKEIENYEKTLSQSEEDLGFLMQLYSSQKITEKADKKKELILEKYPAGEQAETIKIREVYGMKDAAKKSELANKFKEQFPNSLYITDLFPGPSQALIQAGKYEEAFTAIKKNPKAYSRDYNELAQTMYEKDANLPLAKEVALKGIGLIDAEIQTLERPPYYSESQWKKLKKSSSYAIVDTYGAILLKLGENAEALKYMTQAYEMNSGKSAVVNERYAQALLSNGKIDEAHNNLEKFISSGKCTAGMKETLKKIYVKSKGSDSGFDNYLSILEADAKKDVLDKIKKKMINKPAPKFTLTGLDGKKVSLEGLKGKTVIIDFWATWCQPCQASFPGMQKAVTKYMNDSNVKFFFVDVREVIEDWKKNAKNFIEQNKYSFYVLLDEKNKVYDDYKVEGIPTKFIIDKKGNIRFKSVGYYGDENALVEEISAMIELASK